MPKRDFSHAEPIYTFHFSKESRTPEEIRVRRLPDGDLDIRYWRAWDTDEPGVLKPTKGGFTLTSEDFEDFRNALMNIGS